MFSFIDLNGYQVDLSFEPHEMAVEARHVLVLLQHKDKWLCTIHRQRGIEFPGGKAEVGETLEEAAIREVYEETGVVVNQLKWLAQYVVFADKLFCKAVYYATFLRQDEVDFDFETSGMLWLSEEELFSRSDLSFHMKDGCVHKILAEVNRVVE